MKATMEIKRQVLTAKEAAEVLGVSTSKIYNMVNDGSLSAIKIGKTVRIPVAAINSLAGMDIC